jgi:hypothetical protein
MIYLRDRVLLGLARVARENKNVHGYVYLIETLRKTRDRLERESNYEEQK